MIFITCLFASLFLAAVMVIASLALYRRRPGKDDQRDQWTYPAAFFAGVVALFNGVGLTAVGIIYLLVRR